MFSKRILHGILLIFFILCVFSVVFLLWMNKDIKVKSDLSGNNLKLEITNTQNHIDNVEIINNGTIVASSSIPPGETKEFIIKLNKGKNVLDIKSNYSIIYSKEIEIKDTDNTSSLNFNITYKELKVNQAEELVLTICNPGNPTSLTAEIYPNSNFYLDTKEKTKQLDAGGCSNFQFIITPKKIGTHKIVFHIYNETDNINEEVSFDLKVS